MTNLERKKMLSEEDKRISRRNKRLARKMATAITAEWDTNTCEDFFSKGINLK